MVFNIKQNSTLPTLKMKLINDGRNDFNKFAEDLENAAITFSMKDEKTGIYKVANKEGKIILKNLAYTDSKKEYYIGYEFTENDTSRPGIYIGEFKIIFFNENMEQNGSLIVPIGETLYIHIIDSFVKSDVV